MGVTRRQFLLGTSAGLVLPSFYEKAFSYFENHQEPLLLRPRQSNQVMHALTDVCDGFQLHLGDPVGEPPRMTIREFCQAYGSGDPETWWREEWLGVDDSEPVDMEGQMEPLTVHDWWYPRDSPEALAFKYLEGLDLGPELEGPQVVGRLDFVDGVSPAHDYMAVEARDGITSACFSSD
jgi:hypothetical protein